MDKKLNNKYMMYLGTDKVMGNYKLSWELIPILVTLVAEFKTLIARIAAAAVEAGVVLTGVTGSKNDTLDDLKKLVFGLISMLALYAERTKNRDLLAKVSLEKGEVQKKRQNELLLYAGEVAKWLTKYKAELIASYGLTEDMLVQFNNLIEEFTDEMPEPDAKYSDKKAARERLIELFGETDTFLENQLDKAINSQSEKLKELHAAYYNARAVKDLGIRHEPEPENGTEETKVKEA
jgi:hypothetical protein